MRTFTKRPANPKTPRERLAQRIWDQNARNYTAIGETWEPDADGAPVLIEENDHDLRAAGLDGRLQDSLPETVYWDAASRSWVALVIFTNDGGPQFIVPDEPWVDRFGARPAGFPAAGGGCLVTANSALWRGKAPKKRITLPRPGPAAPSLSPGWRAVRFGRASRLWRVMSPRLAGYLPAPTSVYAGHGGSIGLVLDRSKRRQRHHE